MHSASGPFVLIALLATPTAVLSQDLPPVEPGGVATVGVLLPLPAETSRPFRYTIEPAPGVRIFAETSGTFDWLEEGAPVLPVTFSVPRDHPAGPFTAARIELTSAEGASRPVELRVAVRTRRSITLGLEADPGTVAPGESTVLRYTVANRGNAVDTVRLRIDTGGWAASGLESPLVIARGDTVVRTTRVTAPVDARVGELRLVRLSLAKLRSSPSASARLRVAREAGILPGWVHIPTTVFVGTSLGGTPGTSALDRTGFALEMAGSVAPETDLSVSYRRPSWPYRAPAFRGELTGPRLRVALHRPGWRAAVGDVSTTGSILGGSYVQGRGLDARWSGERYSGKILVARPLDFGGTAAGGHLARAGMAVKTPLGRVGATLADLNHAPGAYGPTGRIRSGGLTYELHDVAGHRFSAEAGVLRLVAPTGETVTGSAVDASYSFHGRRFALAARLRRAPAAMPGTGVLADEAYLGGNATLFEGFGIVGSAFARSTDVLGRNDRHRAEGGSAGVRFSVFGGRIDVLANYRSTTGSGFLARSTDRRTITAGFDFPLGPLRLEGTAEAGELTLDGVLRTLENYRVGLHWFDDAGWAWLGASYAEGEYGATRLRLDLNGSWRTHRLTIEGGAGTTLELERTGEAVSFWGGLDFDITPDLSIVAGTEYQPWRTQGRHWTASIGFSSRFSLPVPIPRTPFAEGIVYQDLDGDRRRDPWEPGIDGAAVILGWMETATDARGRFSFPHGAASGRPLQVDAASLGEGLLLPPDVGTASAGHVEIPVVRTAALRLHLFLDLDDDGERDDAEPAAANARVTLLDTRRRERHAAADENGVVVFSALIPGRYSLAVYGPSARGRTRVGTRLDVTLDPGETRTLLIAADHRPVEIRFGEGPPAGEAIRPAASEATLYTVQVGAFLRDHGADWLARRLSAYGLPVWSDEARVNDLRYYRVRVGALPTAAEARRLGKRLAERYALPVWITRVEPGTALPDDVVAATGLLLRQPR